MIDKLIVTGTKHKQNLMSEIKINENEITKVLTESK